MMARTVSFRAHARWRMWRSNTHTHTLLLNKLKNQICKYILWHLKQKISYNSHTQVHKHDVDASSYAGSMSRFVSVSSENPTQQRHELKHEESRLVLSVHLLLSVWWEDVVLTVSRWIQVKDLLLFLSHLLTSINHTLRGLKKKTHEDLFSHKSKLPASQRSRHTHLTAGVSAASERSPGLTCSVWATENKCHHKKLLSVVVSPAASLSRLYLRAFCQMRSASDMNSPTVTYLCSSMLVSSVERSIGLLTTSR